MSLSKAEYARHRGCSRAAVTKAIKSGRISVEPDGSIDPEKADREWQANTKGAPADAPEQKPEPMQRSVRMDSLSLPADKSLFTNPEVTFAQAQTTNEILKAFKAHTELLKLQGAQVDRDRAISHVFSLARAERDAWMSWPARVAALIAMELGVEAHAVRVILDREVRQHLTELSEPNLSIN